MKQRQNSVLEEATARSSNVSSARNLRSQESATHELPFQFLDQMQSRCGNRETARWIESNPNLDPGKNPPESANGGAPGQVMRMPEANSAGEHRASADHPLSVSSDCPAAAPPGLDGFLAADRGKPLPDKLRTSAEQEFGRSLAGVRTHSGSAASALARQAKARAFTRGEDVVFRGGDFIPETPGGRQLLWHELSHVASSETGTSRVYRAPLYDLTDWKIPTPAQGHTAKSMQEALAKKIAKVPPDITSATVKGVTPGTEAEIFLLHILFQTGNHDRWDTFERLETDIGWAPAPAPGKAGTAGAPQGLVNVTIDDKGNAVAELVHAGPAWHATTGKSGPDAMAQIKNDFQMRSVAKGDKEWGEKGFEHDAADVLDAFQLLPPSNKSALKGVDLLRFATLPKDHSGEFNSGGGVVFNATTITALPSLKLADSAFASVSKGPPQKFFQGERVQGDYAHQTPASFETVLHESGHAVEAQVYRPAKEALDQALIKQNVAAASLNAAIAKEKAATASGDSSAAKLAADAFVKRSVYDKAVALVQKDKKALNATRVSDKVIKPLSTDAATKKKDSGTATNAALTVAKGFTPLELTESTDYRNAVAATTVALDDYEKKSEGGDLDVMDDALLAVFATRDTKNKALAATSAANPALATFAPVEATQNDRRHALRMLAHTRGRSLRLNKFVDVVNAAHIVPFTEYARKNWPYKPQEFYAEAFSLWLTDPDFVQKNYLPVFNFFDSGDYQK